LCDKYDWARAWWCVCDVLWAGVWSDALLCMDEKGCGMARTPLWVCVFIVLGTQHLLENEKENWTNLLVPEE